MVTDEVGEREEGVEIIGARSVSEGLVFSLADLAGSDALRVFRWNCYLAASVRAGIGHVRHSVNRRRPATVSWAKKRTRVRSSFQLYACNT